MDISFVQDDELCCIYAVRGERATDAASFLLVSKSDEGDIRVSDLRDPVELATTHTGREFKPNQIAQLTRRSSSLSAFSSLFPGRTSADTGAVVCSIQYIAAS